MKKHHLLFVCMLACGAYTKTKAQNWLLSGNSGTSTSNFLGTTDNKPLIFRTNNRERGRILNSGQWRFGTTTNYAQVDSLGKLSFTGTGSYIVGANKYAFQYAGNSNYGLFFNSTAVQYEFRNGSAVPVFYVGANTGNAVFNGTVKVGAYTLPAADGAFGQVLKTNGAGVLSWQTDYGSGATQWVPSGSNIYFTSGNVGVGTSDPVAKLDVTGGNWDLNSTEGDLRIGNVLYRLKVGVSTSGSGAGDVRLRAFGGTGRLIFGNDAMAVDNAGNVGLGTLSPTAKMQITANSSVPNPTLLLYETEAEYARLSFRNNSSSSFWSIAGFNSPTNSAERLNFYNSVSGDILSLSGDGRVSIGTTSPATGYKLSVQGKVICEELKVSLRASWPDYVFDKNYKLMKLNDLENYVNENKHLPGIAPADEMEKDGLTVGDMQTKMMQKIEEITLYLIELKKENEALRQMITATKD